MPIIVEWSLITLFCCLVFVFSLMFLLRITNSEQQCQLPVSMLPSIQVFCHQPKFVSSLFSTSVSILLSRQATNEHIFILLHIEGVCVYDTFLLGTQICFFPGFQICKMEICDKNFWPQSTIETLIGS